MTVTVRCCGRGLRAVILTAALCALVPAGPARAAEEAPAPPAEASAQAHAEAQAEAALKALPPELQMVLTKLDEANAKLQDVTAKVAYERSIPLLDEKQKSTGSLVFKKPDLIILKLGKPRNEEVYTNGETWWVVSLDTKQVEIYTTAKSGQGSQEAAFLDFGYGSSSKKLLEDYNAELTGKAEAQTQGGQETVYRVKLTPKKRPDRPARYAAIEVEVSDKLWLPRVLILHESGGEIVHTYALSDIRVNTGVKDAQFNYEPPSGYTVVRPQE